MGYRIKTSDITGGAAMPVKKGTFDFYNTEFDLLESSIFLSMAADNTAGVVLSGCIPTITGSTYSFPFGYVYCQGKIVFVSASSFTVTGGQVPVFKINTSYFNDPTADPVTFTDGNSYSVHQIYTGIFEAGNAGSGAANWSDMMYWNTPWVTFTHNYVQNAAWRIKQGELQFKGQIKVGAGNANNVVTLPSWVKVRQTAMRWCFMYEKGDTSYTYSAQEVRVDSTTNIVSFGDGPFGGTVGAGSINTVRWDLSAACGIQLF